MAFEEDFAILFSIVFAVFWNVWFKHGFPLASYDSATFTHMPVLQKLWFILQTNRRKIKLVYTNGMIHAEWYIAVVPSTQIWKCLLEGTMVSVNAKSLNYVGYNTTLDHSLLTMLWGNTPLVWMLKQREEYLENSTYSWFTYSCSCLLSCELEKKVLTLKKWHISDHTIPTGDTQHNTRSCHVSF